MEVKKIIRLVVIIFIALFIMMQNNAVNAVGYNISATSNDVKVGESVTINVSFTAAAWNVTVSGNGISGESYASQTDDLSEKTTTKSFPLDTSKEGTYTITIVGDITDENGVVTKISKSTTVKVSKEPNTTTPEQPTTPEEPTSPKQPTTPVTKSTEARLDTFGIRPNDFRGFSKNRDKENWSTTVPNSVTEVEVYGTALDKNAKVEGAGKVTLKEGNNTVKVTVTAEAGNTKTYTLTIKRKTVAEESAENGDARLKTLGIKPEEYDFKEFDSEKTEYSVEVPNEVDKIEVYATAINSSTQITGTGMIKLKEGKNELKVEVISANGTKTTYTLEVTRKETDRVSGTAEEKFGLSTLSIQGITLKPSFKIGAYEYTAELDKDLSSLNIQAKANDENATVEIYGNENLQQGENVITIQVINKENQKTATYQIIINKNVVEETVQTSWLKPSTWGQEEKIKIAIIVVLIILIIFAIVLKVKISNESNKDKEVYLPGAEELDKAIAEHQELSEEPSYTEDVVDNISQIIRKEDIPKSEFKQNYIEDIAKNKFGEIEDETDEKAKRKGRHF